QKTGRSFRYAIRGGCVVPSTTNRQLPRSHFARAYERAPLRGPGQLQDLQGPSYLFAILADSRVSHAAAMTARQTARLSGSAGRAASPGPGAGPARSPSLSLGRSLGHAGLRACTAPASLRGSLPGELLTDVDPRRALLVVTCSAAKADGGQPASADSQEH